jgi:hypothetical protein
MAAVWGPADQAESEEASGASSDTLSGVGPDVDAGAASAGVGGATSTTWGVETSVTERLPKMMLLIPGMVMSEFTRSVFKCPLMALIRELLAEEADGGAADAGATSAASVDPGEGEEDVDESDGIVTV